MTYSDDDVADLLREAGDHIEMDAAFREELRQRIRRKVRRGEQPLVVYRPPRRPQPPAVGWGARVAQVAAVLVLTVLIGFVAWQQANVGPQGVRYFIPVDGDRLSDYQRPPERANVGGTLLWRNLTREEAQHAARFAYTEPDLVEAWRYAGATISENGWAVTLSYRQLRGVKISITQERIPLLLPEGSRVPIGLDMTVTERTVNGAPAEYVEGTWNNVPNIDDTLREFNLNDRSDVWEPDPSYQTLRWQEGRTLYTVQIFGDLYMDIVTFAESLNLGRHTHD